MWVSFFNRPRSAAKKAIDGLSDDDRAVAVGPVIAEILQGCRNAREAEWIASLLGGLRSVHTQDTHWRQAGLLGLDLRRNELVLPLSDLVIAAVATDQELEVYTIDPHFSRIPGIRLFKP